VPRVVDLERFQDRELRRTQPQVRQPLRVAKECRNPLAEPVELGKRVLAHRNEKASVNVASIDRPRQFGVEAAFGPGIREI
jgi:hypothetical protein